MRKSPRPRVMRTCQNSRCNNVFSATQSRIERGGGKFCSKRCSALGRKHTPETKEKMSKNHADVNGKNNPFYGKKWSEEQKENLRIKRIGKKHSPETLEKMRGRKRTIEWCQEQSKRMVGEGNPMFGKHFSPETIEKMRLSAKDKHAGKNNPMYGKTTHSRGEWYTLPNGNKIWLRSSFEMRVAKILTERNIRWEYEPIAFPLENIEKTYRPDFYLPDYDLWLEVKGWMRPSAQEKIDAFFIQYPDKNLTVLFEKDIIELENCDNFDEIADFLIEKMKL